MKCRDSCLRFSDIRARADQLFIVINMLDFDMEMSKSRGIPQKRVKCPSASNRSIFFYKVACCGKWTRNYIAHTRIINVQKVQKRSLTSFFATTYFFWQLYYLFSSLDVITFWIFSVKNVDLIQNWKNLKISVAGVFFNFSILQK